MECVLERISDAPIGHLHRCGICTRRRESRRSESHKIHRSCPGVPVDDDYVMPAVKAASVVPATGPGAKLKAIFSALGLRPSVACQCDRKANWMNLWGVDGCRQRRELIVGWLKTGKEWFGPEEQAVAAYNAVASGLAFKLKPWDLFGSIVDLAIQQAEQELA